MDGARRLRSLLLLLWALAGCNPPQQTQSTESTQRGTPPQPPSAEVAPTKGVSVKAAPAPEPIAIRAALQKLETQLRAAAGIAGNPWALGHGILAFGPAFETTDGESAVAALMRTATPVGPGAAAEGDALRYRFPKSAPDGTPIEPHPHALALAMRAAGVAQDTPHIAADGSTITLGRLLADLRDAPDPDSVPGEVGADDGRWHSVAWRLAALSLDADAAGPQYDTLRARALQRLEQDIKPFIGARAAGAFSPKAPMGAAKRQKTHLYGHSCGGLHFLDAVVRSHPAAGAGDPQATARVRVALGTLEVRFKAEHSLYGGLLRQSPSHVLLLTVQQLKFYGHVLEVLGRADAMGYRRDGAPQAKVLADIEARATAALLEVLARLDSLNAYGQLDVLAAKHAQTYLDLIGDGCHAVAALRGLLQRIEAR